MCPSQKPTFSQLVCSAPLVRAAFAEHTPTRGWWRIILLLHGKPMPVSLSLQQRTQRVAEGFLFYAKLYRFLAGLFALLALSLFWLSQNLEISWFYGGACLLAALFLESVSGLGGHRSNRLRRRQAAGETHPAHLSDGDNHFPQCFRSGG